MIKHGSDPLIVDAGDLFFSTKKLESWNKKSEEFRAKSILNGYARIGYDIINIGQYEVINGLTFLKNVTKDSDINFISANLRESKTGALIFKPYHIFQRGGLNIGVIGVTDMLPDTSKSIIADDYIEVCRKYAKELSSNVDLVIALINAERANQTKLAEKFDDVDFIITSGSTNMTRPSSPQKEGGPFLYSCGKQGKYLMTIDVERKDANKPFIDVSAEEKKIKNIEKRFARLQKKEPGKKLEEIYKNQQNVLSMIEQYKTDIQSSKSLISSATNTIKFQTIPLNKKIGDDEDLLAFVNTAIQTCQTLAPTKNRPKVSGKKNYSDPHHGHHH